MAVMNTLCNILSNYHMFTKVIAAIYNDDNNLRFALLLALRLFILFIIVMWAMYPVFGLNCYPDPYPSQLAALMYLDFFNSATDMLITCNMPRTLNKIKEVRRRAGSIIGDNDITSPQNNRL